jgi:hypothetical protein
MMLMILHYQLNVFAYEVERMRKPNGREQEADDSLIGTIIGV